MVIDTVIAAVTVDSTARMAEILSEIETAMGLEMITKEGKYQACIHSYENQKISGLVFTGSIIESWDRYLKSVQNQFEIRDCMKGNFVPP